MTTRAGTCLLALAIAASACAPSVEPPARFEVGTNRVGYLWAETRLPLGDLSLVLPERLHRGETVSGMVLVDQAGGAWSDEPTADHVMADWTLELGSWSGRLLDGVEGVPVPAGTEALPLRLRHPDGRLLAEGRLPVHDARTAPGTNDWAAPSWCQASGLFRLRGPFDGFAGNTTVSVGGVVVDPWLESAGELLGREPRMPPGRQELIVEDGDREFRSVVQVLDVDAGPLSFDVAEGEVVDFELTVSGLEGFEAASPPSLQVSLWMDRAEGEDRRYPIEASEAREGLLVIRDSVTAPASGRLRVNGGLIPPAF